jgi:hypothetical protein
VIIHLPALGGALLLEAGGDAGAVDVEAGDALQRLRLGRQRTEDGGRIGGGHFRRLSSVLRRLIRGNLLRGLALGGDAGLFGRTGGLCHVLILR